MKSAILISVLAVLIVGGCKNQKIEKTPCINLQSSDFRRTIDGKTTDIYFLHRGDLSAAITNYGGRIVSLCVPGRNGELADVVLGFRRIDDYLQAKEPFHGALIGRVANRIAKGQFELDGVTSRLPLNNGPNHLHGGPRGFHNVVWDVKSLTDSSLTLMYLSKDGEMGYPGNLKVDVQYTLSAKNELKIDYHASSDKATPVNLTNHSFFNLAGEGNGSVNDQWLTINADYYLPVDSTLIPLGRKELVEGTPFDFRNAKPMGQDLILQNKDAQLKNGLGYDHNFILNENSNKELTWAATVFDPSSGRKMKIITSEPGLQFYSGNFMDGSDTGKSGKKYNFRESFALETQHFPDSPNHPEYPSVILRPGEEYRTSTIYMFSVE